MADNENSILFSLAHLRQMATASVAGGNGTIALTRPTNVTPFVPLSIMPVTLPARRSWNAGGLVPAIIAMASLLTVSLVALTIVLLRAPESRPVAIPAASPAVLAPSKPSPTPTPAVAVASSAEKPLATATNTSTDEGRATTAAAPASVKSSKAKLAKHNKHRQRFAKSKTRAKTLAHHGRNPNKVASVRRSRSELDDLLDAALKE